MTAAARENIRVLCSVVVACGLGGEATLHSWTFCEIAAVVTEVSEEEQKTCRRRTGCLGSAGIAVCIVAAVGMVMVASCGALNKTSVKD